MTMPRFRNSERLSCLILALMVAAAAGAQEPGKWLERMNTALTTRNYDGTFSHWQGGKVETLRIIHRMQDGAVSERLVSLDGSGREFIRTGSDLACYLPDKRTVLVERRPVEESLFGNFPAINEQTSTSYDIREIARTRLNRRDTRVILIAPRDEFRYGYRLWIDETTAMPMKTELCDARGHVIEQIVFSSLVLSSRIPDSAFKPEVSTEGFQWLRNESPVPKEPTASSSLVWNALKLPPGFKIAARSAQVMPGATAPVDHLVFTDGMASVSVFVETQQKPPDGQTTESEVSARVGSSSAFSTMIDGHKVTAVGEVPPATVRFIANSVKAQSSLGPSLSPAAAPTLAPAMGSPRR
jgi:sigma-E factor negative regulatory protein RseB